MKFLSDDTLLHKSDSFPRIRFATCLTEQPDLWWQRLSYEVSLQLQMRLVAAVIALYFSC